MITERVEAPTDFVDQLAVVTRAIVGKPLDGHLVEQLNRDFPADELWFARTRELCEQGCQDGWLCAREAGGIRFGRPVKPSSATAGMSVDVVDMKNVAGPRHAHPNGEIDLVMPLEGPAEFDGCAAGWKVYGPNTVHEPTVAGGRALVLYLLPDGAIDFASSAG
ncbi:4-hydroxylaminobenzoate lyase [Aurantiacibacter sediminis]|uniref:DUF4863 family protein n=1 Tax=Aurantiacibacter sediminis TaxID=2793064 RepID=A0ABS0N6Q2_9SPHN|nr:DUF4863 family protein [Aurantiacibacter sediminis]MBH5323435.1 DUF4863 family protein [Aurantiacibacter sediminis]